MLRCDCCFVLQEFALCTQWIELHAVSDQVRLQLKSEHLLHLLETGQTDEAFEVKIPYLQINFRLKSVLFLFSSFVS